MLKISIECASGAFVMFEEDGEKDWKRLALVFWPPWAIFGKEAKKQ